ncbi:MAG: phosphate acyltransferase PlsX [Thermodesulfobacteriota bacterium]|nr:phosphate acyltransferase PlsX [Thermodesulfobacteriota bacterium]
MTTHIALDAMGGDRGPDEVVSGAIQAVNESDIEVTLLGNMDRLSTALGDRSNNDRIHVLHTTEIISMDESPIRAVKKKKDSSIVVAVDLLKQGKVQAVVSAGNSGATMAAAIKGLGKLQYVSRPGILSIYPTLKKPLVMMDSGANVDCRPIHLLQFGIMASAFSKVIFDINEPRIGLLSIGEESSKGNTLVRKSRELLQESHLNFIGNVEGRDAFHGDVDVIVCDGFVGNVCLKLSEGLAEAMIRMLRDEIGKTFVAKIGYMLAGQAFENFRKKVDYTEYGGGPLLGLNGIAIICHGQSNANAIKNALKQAGKLVQKEVNRYILDMLKTCNYSDLETAETSPQTKTSAGTIQ